jgi:hypothetical protein
MKRRHEAVGRFLFSRGGRLAAVGLLAHLGGTLLAHAA